MADDAKRAFYLGRYNCIERLGQGPIGETFRAKIYGVAGFEKQFAVKRLHAELCVDEPFVARFVTAATSYAGLDHERIARVHEVNVQGSQYYLVVDLVRGLDLAGLLRTLHTRGEAVSSDGALLLALDLAEALEHAHARKDLLPGGVLHLGLSPQTVMLTFEGEVKLLDVGLVASLVRPGWADSDALVPTLAYLAPEELRGGPVDARADVFSLGAILYELLSGERAFAGERAADVRRQVESAPPSPPPTDGRVQALLGHALAADPEARFPSVTALREALVPILGSRVSKARAELASLVRRLGRPVSRTGSFAAVVLPPGPMPAPAPPSAAAAPWSPPASKPPARVAPPVPPQLSSPPPINTLAGMGAGDRLEIDRLTLPGPATTPTMPAIVVGDDANTTPMEKIDLEPLLAMTSDQAMDAPPADVDELIEPPAPPNISPPPIPNLTPAAPQDFSAPPPIPNLTPAPPPSADFFAAPPPPPNIPPPPIPGIAPPPIPPASLPSLFTAPPTGAPPPLPPPPESANQPTLMGEAPSSLFAPPPPSVESPAPLLSALIPEGPEPPGPPAPPVLAPLPLLPAAPRRGPARWIGIAAGAVAAAGIVLIVLWRQPPKTSTPATTPVTQTTTPPSQVPTKPDSPSQVPTQPTVETTPPSHPTTAPPIAKTTPPSEIPTKPNPPTENPPATAGSGVDVDSTPPGANVYVDGELRGPTPLRVELAAGSHRLTVLGEGYKLVKRNLASGAPRVDLKLEPAALPPEIAGPAGLKVRCKTANRIFVDGNDTGRACPNDERIGVTAGSHKIGLYSPATDETHEVEHDVADGEHSTRVYVKF